MQKFLKTVRDSIFSNIFNSYGDCAPVCSEYSEGEDKYEVCTTYIGYDNLYYRNFSDIYQFGKYWEVSCKTKLSGDIDDGGNNIGSPDQDNIVTSQNVTYTMNISCEQCKKVDEDDTDFVIDISPDTIGSDRLCFKFELSI